MKIGMIKGADTAQAEGDWRHQCPFLMHVSGVRPRGRPGLSRSVLKSTTRYRKPASSLLKKSVADGDEA